MRTRSPTAQQAHPARGVAFLKSERDQMAASNQASHASEAKQAAIFATIACAGFLYYLAALIVLHFIEPGYNPLSRTISEYAVGQYGFVMTSAFFARGLALLALAIGLYQGVSPPGRSSAGIVLLCLSGVATLVTGIFRTDLKGALQTTSGNIHIIAALVTYIGLAAAFILLSQRFRHDPQWKSFRGLALALALAALVGLVVFLGASGTELAGLFQRIYTLLFLIWLLLTASRLRSIASSQPQ